MSIGGSILVDVEGAVSARFRPCEAAVENGFSPSSKKWDALEGVTEGGISTGARSRAAVSCSFTTAISSLASTTAAESYIKHEGRSLLTSKFILETLAFLFNSSFIEELVFKENLLFEYFRIFLLGIGEAG